MNIDHEAHRDRVAADVRSRRYVLLFAALGGVCVLALFAVFLTFYLSVGKDVDNLRSVANDAADRAQVLEGQVRDLGGIPRVQAPERVEGERGEQGDQGDQGPRGDRGEPGLSPPCMTEPARCRGVDGTPGPQGPQGVPGKDGADGEGGADGKDGVDGAPGKDGADGAPGKDGIDGSAPASWVLTRADGSQESCTRNPESTSESPTYTCVLTPPPSTPDVPTTTSTIRIEVPRR